MLFHDDAPAYVKRMWVDDAVRGMGVGRRILVALEQAARDHGAASVTLETNASLTEAIAMYRASGYVEVEPSTTSSTPTTGSRSRSPELGC